MKPISQDNNNNQNNSLTYLAEIIRMLSSTGHPYLTSLINDGGAMVNETVKVKLYPFRDMTRDKATRIDVHIINGSDRSKKSIKVIPANSGEPVLTLHNHSGVPFDIPLKMLLEISNLVNSISEKVKNGESIKTLMMPNPTMLEFVNAHFRECWNAKQKFNKFMLDKVIEYWKERHIKDIYSIDIEKFKLMLKDKLAPGTVRKYCLLLQQIFALALELGYIERNPFQNVKLPSDVVQEERTPISQELLPGLFQKMFATDKTLFNYCVMIYLTGLRPQDISKLTYDNIVIEQGIKVIKLVEQKTSSFRGETIVPLHPDIERLILKESGTGFILDYDYNRGVDMVRILGKKFKNKITADYTPYQFKHTMLSELANLGVNETHINFLNGKLPEGTLKHYLKRDLKILQEAILRLP